MSRSHTEIIRRAVIIAFSTLSLAAISCSGPPKVSLNPTATTPDPDAYFDVFRKWSREVSVLPFSGLDNILTARVTYLSREFRQYYVEREAADLDASPAERRAMEAAEKAEHAKGHAFYVTLMSAVADCDELSEDEGAWTIRLRNDSGAEVAPISVEEIDSPMPEDIVYFTFDPKLRKAYRLRFPLTLEDGRPVLPDNTTFFELSFASPLGKDTARWDIY